MTNVHLPPGFRLTLEVYLRNEELGATSRISMRSNSNAPSFAVIEKIERGELGTPDALATAAHFPSIGEWRFATDEEVDEFLSDGYDMDPPDED